LRYRFITLMVTISTLVATVLLFIVVPKGFFPVQDTGVILGISEAPQTVSFLAWPSASRSSWTFCSGSGRR
jgi:multidrug efflux pump